MDSFASLREVSIACVHKVYAPCKRESCEKHFLGVQNTPCTRLDLWKLYKIDISKRLIVSVGERLKTAYQRFDADPIFWLDPELPYESSFQLDQSFDDVLEQKLTSECVRTNTSSKHEFARIIEHITALDVCTQVPVEFKRVLKRQERTQEPTPGRSRVRWADEKQMEDIEQDWRLVLKKLEML